MNTDKSLLEEQSQPSFLGGVSGIASAKANPYTLVWYRADWDKMKTEKNNAKYWEWEIMYNGFKCP